MRKEPLRRKAPPKARRKPLPKTNPVRRAKERFRTYGGIERLSWIQGQPSILSGKLGCVNVHVRGGGAGRKSDAKWIVPLTEAEHHELHQHGQKTFEAAHQIDLLHWAAVIDARWEQYVASQPKPETE